MCLLESAFTDSHLEFNVTEYSGTKAILISTRTVLGGKNPFMGIAYVVVGGVCVLLGAGFTIAYLVRPRYELITNTVKYALTNPIFAGNWVIIPT